MSAFFGQFSGTGRRQIGWRRLLLIGLLLLAGGGSVAQAMPIILYNSTTGQKPQDQGWFYLATGATTFDPPQSVIENNLGNTMLFDTADPITDRAGYSRIPGVTPVPPGVVLDRTLGYSLSINVQITNENHNTNDRAGWSLIVLGHDNRGIEIGFWEDRVFAQSTTFTHAEEALYDTTAAITNYTLSVFGDSYAFFAPGMANPMVGPLRQYPSNGFPSDPYGLSNFIFVGDNTSSAEVQALFTQVGYSPVVPEPSWWWGAASLAAAVLCGRHATQTQRAARIHSAA
ncbi:MAG: hypothetical protein SFX18_01635 [Pirellulales bacterium]|nr:hypothetical protein [Pirellulales bacterium]